MEVELLRVSDNAEVVLIYTVTTDVMTDVKADAVEEFAE